MLRVEREVYRGSGGGREEKKRFTPNNFDENGKWGGEGADAGAGRRLVGDRRGLGGFAGAIEEGAAAFVEFGGFGEGFRTRTREWGHHLIIGGGWNII